jgi:hypothetical protein
LTTEDTSPPDGRNQREVGKRVAASVSESGSVSVFGWRDAERADRGSRERGRERVLGTRVAGCASGKMGDVLDRAHRLHF